MQNSNLNIISEPLFTFFVCSYNIIYYPIYFFYQEMAMFETRSDFEKKKIVLFLPITTALGYVSKIFLPNRFSGLILKA